MLDFACFWVDWQDRPHFTADQVCKVNFDKNGTIQTTMASLEMMAAFEPLLVLHLKWVRVSHKASQIARCDQFKVSQRSVLQVVLLHEARNPAVQKKQHRTLIRRQGDCSLEFKVETSRLLPGQASRRWLKESKSLFAIKTTHESLDHVVTIWNLKL